MRTMSSVDTAWLRMEEPANLMMITALLFFDGPLAYDDVRRTLEERLLRFERFRRRVVRSKNRFGRPRWEADPDFDLDAHLRRITLPAPGGEAALQAVVNRLMSHPLDADKPLWQFHLVEGCAQGSVLVVRLHHCLADGITLVRVLLSLADEAPGADATYQRPSLFLRAGGEAEERPAVLDRLVDAARLGVQSVGAVGRLLLRRRDPETVFSGPLSTSKRAAWSEPVPLEEVKMTAQAAGATVNDVLMATATGTLRRYMAGCERLAEGLDIRAAVPVNLRPLGGPLEMGNKFGLVFLALPVGAADPLVRLRALKQRMDVLKASPEPLVVLGLLGAIGLANEALQQRIVDFLAAKVTAVATNVPGPRRPLYLAGARLRRIMPWVPQAGRVGLGLSLISYAGNVSMGVATDAGLVPDPEKIASAFPEELDHLRQHLAARPGAP